MANTDPINSPISAIQIITVPRSTSPRDWLIEKRTFSGHTAINVVSNGVNILTEGFSPSSDLNMILPVASYWLESILHHKIADWLKGAKDAQWQDDSPMLRHPKLKALSIELPTEMVSKFLEYFEEIKADRSKKYTLMPGQRSIVNELTEKNCVFSAINVFSDFFLEHQQEFSAEEWSKITPKIQALIEDTAKELNTRQGHLNRNIAQWEQMNVKFRALVVGAGEIHYERLSSLAEESAAYKANRKFYRFAENISLLLDSKDHVSSDAINLTELFINIMDDNAEATALKQEWAEYKNKYGISTAHLTEMTEKYKDDFAPLMNAKTHQLLEKAAEILFLRRFSLDKSSEAYKENEKLYAFSEGIAILLDSTDNTSPAFTDLMELFVNQLDNSQEMALIKAEWTEYKDKFGIISNHLVDFSVNLPNGKESYTELLMILQSADFIEPGIPVKEQIYPNFVGLIKALQNHENFSVIQDIANKGVEMNRLMKEKNASRDPEQLDKRITMFECIKKANSLDEALQAIKNKWPEYNKVQDATARHH